MKEILITTLLGLAFAVCFTLLLDAVVIVFGEPLSSVERISAFVLSVGISSSLVLMAQKRFYSKLGVRKTAVISGVFGFLYLYVLHPLLDFDQSYIVTFVQMVTDLPTVLNIFILVLGPFIVATAISKLSRTG